MLPYYIVMIVVKGSDCDDDWGACKESACDVMFYVSSSSTVSFTMVVTGRDCEADYDACQKGPCDVMTYDRHHRPPLRIMIVKSSQVKSWQASFLLI